MSRAGSCFLNLPDLPLEGYVYGQLLDRSDSVMMYVWDKAKAEGPHLRIMVAKETLVVRTRWVSLNNRMVHRHTVTSIKSAPNLAAAFAKPIAAWVKHSSTVAEAIGVEFTKLRLGLVKIKQEV